jgi:hypothetical protein
MKNNPNKLWITVIALGWAFDFLIWKQTAGINFALFTSLCVIAAFLLLLWDGLRPGRATLALLPLFVFFAVVSFLRAEPMTAFLAYSVTLLVMTILAVTYLGGRWMQYTVADYLKNAVNLVGSLFLRPITAGLDARRARAEAGIAAPRHDLWPVLRGLVVALPVVAVFASLLASADLVFGQRLGDLMDLLRLENLPEYILRLVIILFVGYALAGAILHAASESKDEKLVGEERPFLPPFIGFVESSIVLGSVVLLFAAFVLVQFRYFFGGQANITLEGFTYAEYARRGFGELVTVAFFSLLLLLGLSAATRRESASQRRAFSGLGAALVALLLVMLLSAYQRLGLYEAVYGFSRLRTYTHVFLAWLGLLLVATIALEILHRERIFAFAALAASFGFAISLPILNVDAFIVQQNIRREIEGAALEEKDRVSLDVVYLQDLSDDAVPPLVLAFRDSSLPQEVRGKIGAALACIAYERGLEARERSWRSFHLARAHAERALDSVERDLREYKVNNEDGWPVIVTAPPSGEEHSCWPYDYD